METTSTHSLASSGWREALRWGFGVALAHRLFLMVWLAIVWATVGEPNGLAQALQATEAKGQANLPQMELPIERAFFSIWRRWDGIHYFNLAQNGYRVTDPGPTVFSPLTPLGIHLSDVILPGPIEIGGIVFTTLMFGLALTFLYQFVEIVFSDVALARRSVIMLALLPLSYFFAAPMSEAPYLAMVLGFFVFGTNRVWWLAAIFGALATLARSQGVLLMGIGGLMLVEQIGRIGMPQAVGDRVRYAIRNGLPLMLLPLSYVGVMFYRNSIGLPPMETVFREQSFVVLVDPLTGLLSNFRQMALDPVATLQNVDYMALLAALVLTALLVRTRQFRRWSLIAFCAGYLLVFVSKLNYPWGTYTELLGTQSMARYTLTLFPLTILIADYLWQIPKRVRLVVITLSVVGLFIFSAQFALGGGPA